MTRVVVPRGSGPAANSSSQSRPPSAALPPSSSVSSSAALPSSGPAFSSSSTPPLPCTQQHEGPEVHQSFNEGEQLQALVVVADNNINGALQECFSSSLLDAANGGDNDDVHFVESQVHSTGVALDHHVHGSGGAHTILRSHEENDWGRAMGNPNVSSEAIGCSYLSATAPTPSVPFLPSSSSSRRSGLVVGPSASSGTRGGVTYWRIPRAVKVSRNSPNSSRPTSPRVYGEGDGYNSADEQGPWSSGPSGYEDNGERERQFENELRRVKSLEVRWMAEDGNCLFRAVADQVYGDAEMYSETRQLCIDYMEKERDHFSHFVTESFTAYCKRKRRDKVYGNNLEIQAMAEMYNRPIHIYSYSTEPINIFHGSYETDLPPIRLSYHRSNHYNSLLDPCNPAVGAGLGFGSLCGRNVDTEQVKAALKAQQEQQIDKALLAEGRFYSDMERTEQEIEHMVMETSRAEFLAAENSRLRLPWQEETSTSAGAEPSSSGTTTSAGGAEGAVSSNVRKLLSMGFSYLRVMEAHSIFGDHISNMLCYLMETDGCSDGESVSRRKGKAAE
ncbi:unnamed protein product [Sphagnum tenellum]